MKRLGMWGVFAVLGALLLTGCGGGDGDEGSSFAPATLRGKTFVFTGDQGPGTVTFASSGNVYSLTRSDAQLAPVGTFRAIRVGANLWKVNLITPDARFSSELVLNFVAGGRGTFRFTEPGWLQSVTGTFEQVGFAGDPVLPDDPGGPAPVPTGPPASLTQIVFTGVPGNALGTTPITVNFVGASGGTFTTDTSSGTFSYAQTSASTANLVLTHAGPVAPTDEENYTLSFTTGNRGGFVGTQRVGGTTGPASGSFTYTAP